MINKDIEDINKDDLQALINDEVIEHKTIEYKQILPGNSDKDKKEFLADVTSFANASGGDIIYGIVEDKKTGKPKSIDGLVIENPDQEILRLENIIRNGLQPRLPSLTISKPIPIKEDKIALVIRVQKSWISPHRVTLGGHDKFYSRNSSGKYPLDVGELRIAFNLSETMTERIRDFRTDRIAKILANETTEPLNDNPKIVFHLVPVTSLNMPQSYDISQIISNRLYMPTLNGGASYKYNLDGLVSYLKGQYGKTIAYTQLFRNGILEAVESTWLEPSEGKYIIPSTYCEEKFIESLTAYTSLFKSLNIEPPVFIFLTLLGVKGYYLAVSHRFAVNERNIMDRGNLQLSESVIENYDSSAAQLLKPCFDSLWNAGGFPRDLNYNEEGKWRPPR